MSIKRIAELKSLKAFANSTNAELIELIKAENSSFMPMLSLEEHTTAIKSLLGKSLCAESLLNLFGLEDEQYKAEFKEALASQADKQHERLIDVLNALPFQQTRSASPEARSAEVKSMKPTPMGLRAYLDKLRSDGYIVPWHASFDSHMYDRLIKFFTTSTQQYFKQGKTENSIADYNHWRVLSSVDVDTLSRQVLEYFETCNADINCFKHRIAQWLEYAEKLEKMAEYAQKQKELEEANEKLAEQASKYVAKQAEQAKQAALEAELAEPNAPLPIHPAEAEAIKAMLKPEKSALQIKMAALELAKHGGSLSELVVGGADKHIAWTMQQAKHKAELEQVKNMDKAEFLSVITPEAKAKYEETIANRSPLLEKLKEEQKMFSDIMSMTEQDEIEYDYKETLQDLMSNGMTKEEAMAFLPRSEYA